MKQFKLFYFFSFIFFLFVCCKTSLELDNDSFLLWQNPNQLTFKDFRGKPNNLSHNFFGHCVTQYRFEYKIDLITKLPRFTIKCYFNKRKSFIRNKKDTLTLRHEQIHFNIEELFCRKVRKSWDSLNVLKEKRIGIYHKERNRIHKQINLLNKLFDNEEHTITGSILQDNIDTHTKSVLKKWERKIKIELDNLEEYK